MIYTCYEMIRDCRAGNPQGWSFFIGNFAAALRALLQHYLPERDAGALAERLLIELHKPGASLFQSVEPAPERAFVAELRQWALAAAEADCPSAPPEIPLDLETLGTALEPLTLTEKIVVWFETMRYDAVTSARMLRMSPETAEKIRARGDELIRGSVDSWRITVLTENGRQLGEAARTLTTGDCVAPKVFFDVIDGRATWSGREEMEHHVKGCWHCIDHYSRLLEVVDTLRTVKPLGEAEAQHYQQVLGLQPAKRSFWKR